MNPKRSWRRHARWAGAVAVLAGAAFVLATTFAPTTEGLALYAVGHQGTAAPGNRNEASVVLSAYNAAGPIRGIPGGSFSIAVAASPADSDPLAKDAVTEVASGVYRIALAPQLSQHRWSAGSYVISVTLTSPNGSGVVLADLRIGQ